MSKFIKKLKKKRNDNSWDYSSPYDQVWEDNKEDHSMWKGLKEILKKKAGLC